MIGHDPIPQKETLLLGYKASFTFSMKITQKCDTLPRIQTIEQVAHSLVIKIQLALHQIKNRKASRVYSRRGLDSLQSDAIDGLILLAIQ
jgi:hypothetical protein